MQLNFIFSKIKLVIIMQRVRRKRRVRMDRVMILVGAGLLSILLVIGAIFGIYKLINPTLIIDEYAKPSVLKLEDDSIQSDVYSKKDKETDIKYIYAIHIPEFKDEEMNQKVNDFVNGVIEEKAVVTHIDYESNSAFNQYKSYVITATLYEGIDEKTPFNVIKTVQLFINFDNDTYIELDDCIRGKAISKVAKENSANEEDLQLAKITEQGIVIDVLGNKVDYSYDSTSFVMKNPNIPTLLKGERIEIPKREIDPNKPMVAFTFDDGPSPGNTERILAALDKVGGRGTFFQLGYLMEAYPETVIAVAKQGSEIANHSYDHDWLTEKSLDDALADIESVNNIAFSLTGNEITLVRPPYGAYNSALKNGMTEKIVMWDVDTRDWESRNTETIIEVTKKYVYDGSIVLFHDIHSATIPAVERLIEYFAGQGYQFVTVSELYEIKGK